MDTSSLLFMTCDQLRDEFRKCPNEENKRILIIDVRSASLYQRSHLCLDKRSDIGAIKTKMRVMNINPDAMRLCTAKNIMSILEGQDLSVFGRRRDATEVVIIDKDTDVLQDLVSPKSKVMRLISALTKYDNQEDKKIIVPIHILRGGFREWRFTYPHFTTDPSFNPDSEDDDIGMQVVPPVTPSAPVVPQVIPQESVMPTTPIPIMPSSIPTAPILPPKPAPALPPKPVSAPQQKPVSPPQERSPMPVQPMTPSLNQLTISNRPTLPRSYSSPNVAGEDELENMRPTDYNISDMGHKPPIYRALKPRFELMTSNNEAINSIRAQLNFGNSPEASDKSMSGLKNLGNTCFMNSVVQCLAYIPSVVAKIGSGDYYKEIRLESRYGSKGELAVEFAALVEKLNSFRYRYIEPKSFHDAVTKHIGFAGYEQQDSHEFMMMLFDKLHHDLNKHSRKGLLTNGASNNDNGNINISREMLAVQFWRKHLEMNLSFISEQFEGIFMSTLTCTYCRAQSNTFEVFNCLSLPIPSETRCHLRDCLNHFSNPERIEAAWECPRCKQKREADKKIVICKLPKILVIHLKRFSLDGRWRSKLHTTVDFPLNNLRVEVAHVIDEFQDKSTRYPHSFDLCAVVNHYGELNGGHYTAFCKLRNRNWYTFNDDRVIDLRETEVCGKSAYILFYVANQD